MEQEIHKTVLVNDIDALARKIEAEVARYLISTKDIVIIYDDLAKIAEGVVKELGFEHVHARVMFEEVMPYTWFYLVHPGEADGGGGFYLLIPQQILEHLYEEKRKRMLGYVLRVAKRLLDLQIEDVLSFAIKSEEVVKKIASTMCWAFASRFCEYFDDPLSWYYNELMQIYKIEK